MTDISLRNRDAVHHNRLAEHRKIASSAADIIVKMIDDPSFSSYHLTLGVRLIERDSTRCG